ncbi:MAG: hypothetical protein IPO88_10455 [Nannocystis sp.]|nr:hypothetical protein [Nannocystis sp.]
MPIFVARQWIRHRTANANEMSLPQRGPRRVLRPLAPRPLHPPVDHQSQAGPRRRDQPPPSSARGAPALRACNELAYADYQHLANDLGNARELARTSAPGLALHPVDLEDRLPQPSSTSRLSARPPRPEIESPRVRRGQVQPSVLIGSPDAWGGLRRLPPRGRPAQPPEARVPRSPARRRPRAWRGVSRPPAPRAASRRSSIKARPASASSPADRPVVACARARPITPVPALAR